MPLVWERAHASMLAGRKGGRGLGGAALRRAGVHHAGWLQEDRAGMEIWRR